MKNIHKKINNFVIIGDSYSTFTGYNPDGYEVYYDGTREPHIERVEDTWWHLYKTKTNSSLVLNDSWSGSTICYTGRRSPEYGYRSSFVNRMHLMIKDDFFRKNNIDTVFIFGGTNDSWLDETPKGELKFSDWKEEDLYSTLPAISYMISKLKEELQGGNVIFIINTELDPRISEAIKLSSERFGTTYVELEDIDKFSGHPTVKGMKEICDQIYMTTHKRKNTMKKEKVILNNPERFSKPHTIDRVKLEAAAKAACDKLKARVEKEGIGFPSTCSKDYKYAQGANNNWECGMYTGCFWLAYQLTGDEFFKNVAMEQLKTYYTRWENKVGLDDHDVGFVYSVGCVPAYKLLGDENAKKLALDVFDYYYNTSYSHEGKFIIRSHKGWRGGSAAGYRTMMDSLLNAPYFCWASEVTGNPEYKKAAIDHVKTTADYLIREDGSSFHHYQFDPETSKPLYGLTWQGYTDDSCWSRGHSWGVYGFPIAYSYQKEKFIKEVHKKVAYFMLNHLPEDMIPYWDYDFVDGDEPRDSSAGAVSACGFLEMASMMDDSEPDKVIFESAAAQLLEAVIDRCTGDIGVDYDGLICHVTHAKPQGQGIDECAVYGDFFYLEALARYLVPDFKKYW